MNHFLKTFYRRAVSGFAREPNLHFCYYELRFALQFFFLFCLIDYQALSGEHFYNY